MKRSAMLRRPGGDVWIWIASAFAECPPDPPAAIRANAAALEAAYSQVDDAAFESSYVVLSGLAPCVRTALDPSTLVAWHRARALGEFFEREVFASAKSWAAVKRLDPDYRPPEAWVRPGGPLYRAWTETPEGDERIELERTPAGGWRVDGEESSSVPADCAFVLQGFDAAGGVVHTGYHYSIAEVPVVDFEALDTTARQRRRRRMRTLGTTVAGALGAAALTTLGVAWSQELRVKSEKTPLEDVPTHAQRANQLSAVGLGLAGGGAGMLAATWVIRW